MSIEEAIKDLTIAINGLKLQLQETNIVNPKLGKRDDVAIALQDTKKVSKVSETKKGKKKVTNDFTNKKPTETLSEDIEDELDEIDSLETDEDVNLKVNLKQLKTFLASKLDGKVDKEVDNVKDKVRSKFQTWGFKALSDLDQTARNKLYQYISETF